MDDTSAHELEEPEAWETGQAAKHPGVQGRRAVVSVSFPRDEFEVIDECAERAGEKLSEYIRKAALSRALSHSAVAAPPIMSGSSGLVIASPWIASATRTETPVTHEVQRVDGVLEPA